MCKLLSSIKLPNWKHQVFYFKVPVQGLKCHKGSVGVATGALTVVEGQEVLGGHMELHNM